MRDLAACMVTAAVPSSLSSGQLPSAMALWAVSCTRVLEILDADLCLPDMADAASKPGLAGT